jgi:hypothetical protein
MELTLAEIEQIINHWRSLRPATGEERALSREVDVLASVYAVMIFDHARSIALDRIEPEARELVERWRLERAA